MYVFSVFLFVFFSRWPVVFLIIWTWWTTRGLKNAIFTETKQMGKKKTTRMTGIFHRLYNFYRMPTAFIKYSAHRNVNSNELRNQSNFSKNLERSKTWIIYTFPSLLSINPGTSVTSAFKTRGYQIKYADCV